jgi:hypothetical protein
MVIFKDRPGGLRENCPVDGKTQPAGRFVMTAQPDGGVTWHVSVPVMGERSSGTDDSLDVAELDCLDPPPKSKRDVMKRMGWGDGRAAKVLRGWRAAHGDEEEQE